MMTYILSLSDPKADLAAVGGKGASLARLMHAGLPVPDGFHVTTDAYRQFVTVNDLQQPILKRLKKVDAAQPGTFEIASTEICRLFDAAAVPDQISGAIVEAYLGLCGRQSEASGQHCSVAVRSSATAEDLPGASFAGQQETFLNIRGVEAVLEAVRKCWASLWTARAIGYRLRQGIDPEGIALAVVVQLLVPAESAGILFTANPLNGRRHEAVINASWGLGEAIVGGAVTPDTMTVNKFTGRVTRRETAEKQVMTVCTETGIQQQTVPVPLKNKPALNDTQAAELVRFGKQIEALYGVPMDIEWAWTSSTRRKGRGGFTILQARPVTALPEPPIEWLPPNPKGVYMRASVADLMPSPLSPLFITLCIPTFLRQMIPMGKRLIGGEPPLPEDYFTSINGYAYINSGYPARAYPWILFHLLPSFVRLMRSLIPLWRDEMHPQYQAVVAGLKNIRPQEMTPEEMWAAAQKIVDAAMYYTSALMFLTMGASAGSEMLLTRVYEKMARREGDPPASVLLMGWDNIPGRAEKSLFDLAMWCQGRERLAAYVLKTDSEILATRLKIDEPPAGIAVDDWKELQERFKQHQDGFGHIIFQMDFAETLPLDHLEPMLENIKMYLRGEGVNPHERQQANAARRLQVGEAALARLKGFRRWAFRTALKAGQAMAEVREDALAEIGLGYPVLRELLHEMGKRFAGSGAIVQAGDIFWLEKAEIDSLVKGGQDRFQDRVDARKKYHAKLKTETPPPMMPMKERMMGIKVGDFIGQTGEAPQGNIIKGIGASPGVVTSTARVLLGPQDFHRMQPGEVLVAGTTTPAWTPLFAMAAAVVTDIGGPLSHGSIVAREYGVPAVMGTGVATRTIRDGQTITVDGGKGIVTLS